MKRSIIIIFITMTSYLYTSPPVGLENIGNTCYQNAALQCLYNIPELTEFMINFGDNVFKQTVKGRQTVPAAYRDLVRQLNQAQIGSYVKPEAFCLRSWQVFGFTPYAQDDPAIFLTNFIQRIIDQDILTDFKVDRYGYPFFYESPNKWPIFPLFNSFPANLFVVRTLSGSNASINQYQPIQVFISALYGASNIREYINDRFNDADVDKPVNAPLYLLFNRPSGENKPVSMKIKWPFLHMGEFKKEAEYALSGMIIHIGQSDESGHYIAYVQKNNQWYKTDDAQVTEVSENFFDKYKATGNDGIKKIKVLFYRRISAEPTERISEFELLKGLKDLGVSEQKINAFLKNKGDEHGFEITFDDLVAGVNYGAITKQDLLKEIEDFSFLDISSENNRDLLEQLALLEIQLRVLASQLK